MAKQGLYLTSFQRKLLEENLTSVSCVKYRHRIEIMLLADEGFTQTQIRNDLGCAQATVRHWMEVAKSGQAHNWADPPIGRQKVINKSYLDSLQELVNSSPRQFGYSFQRWTAEWLSKHLFKELNIKISPRHVNRLLKKMKLSTREQSSPISSVVNHEARHNSDLTISKIEPELEVKSMELQLFLNLIRGNKSNRL